MSADGPHKPVEDFVEMWLEIVKNKNQPDSHAES